MHVEENEEGTFNGSSKISGNYFGHFITQVKIKVTIGEERKRLNVWRIRDTSTGNLDYLGN